MNQLYGRAPVCPAWLKHLELDDQRFQSYLDEKMSETNPDATPGVPYVKLGPKTGSVLRHHYHYIRSRVEERLRLLKSTDVTKMTAIELVEHNLCDPVRVFVKQEPHKKTKLILGRQRLISSVSLVDNIVERVLHSLLNKHWVSVWDKIPAKPGIGFQDRDVNVIRDNVGSMEDPAALDASHFDWSVNGFYFDWDADFRSEQLCLRKDDALNVALHNRAYCLSLSVFQCSNGTLVEQVDRGIQLSGSYTTSSSNSNIRNMASLLVDIDGHPISMGDDGLDSMYNVDAPKIYYDVCGFNVKMYERINKGNFEFCSHLYTPNNCYGLNIEKALMNLVHQDFNGYSDHEQAKFAFLVGFQDEMGTNPLFPEVVKVLECVGWYA
jgi:hypothetical protein